MTTVELRLTPDGPFRVPLRAPTLFGHLAWAVREQRGEVALRDWLEPFETQPPFLLSSAFPTGFLPRPLLPSAPAANTQLRKDVKRVRYLPFELFREVCSRGEIALVEAMRDDVGASQRHPDWVPSSRTRVTIDRSSGGALQGALYDDDLLWYDGAGSGTTLSIYLRGETPAIDDAVTLLRWVGNLGYGGRASIGMGRFSVTNIAAATLPEAPNATHAVTLAPVLPRADMQGYWRLETYWGRLGGHFATHAKPFKRPHLRVLEGSTLDAATRGGMLDVTPDPPPAPGVRILDYLWAFPLPVEIPA